MCGQTYRKLVWYVIFRLRSLSFKQLAVNIAVITGPSGSRRSTTVPSGPIGNEGLYKFAVISLDRASCLTQIKYLLLTLVTTEFITYSFLTSDSVPAYQPNSTT
jgi:hypothetical protein